MICFLRPQSYGNPGGKITKKKALGVFSIGFSRPEPFLLGVLDSIPEGSGVYILSLRDQLHTYVNNQSSIVYIGQSKNLKNRVLVYLNGYAHTEDIKQFVKNNPLHIRYHKTSDHKAIEARLIHDFVGIFEELPLLNLLKPRMKMDK